MRQICKCKVIWIIACLGLAACSPKKDQTYTLSQFIQDTVEIASIDRENTAFQDALDFGIVKQEWQDQLDRPLTKNQYDFVIQQLGNPFQIESKHEIPVMHDQKAIQEQLKQLVYTINHQEFIERYEYQLKKGYDPQNLQQQDTDIFEQLDLAGSYLIDHDVMQVEHTQLRKHLPYLYGLQRSFTIRDWQVDLKTNQQGAYVELSKQYPYGTKAYARLQLGNIHLDYRIKKQKNHLEQAYFKVDFSSHQKIGLQGNQQYTYSYATKPIELQQFIAIAKQTSKQQIDQITETLKLFQLDIPLGNIPSLTLRLIVQLYVYASGKVEIGFQQDGAIGYEIRNGKLRLIKDFTHQEALTMQAKGGLQTDIYASLTLLNQNLMDLGTNGGIQGNMQAKIYHQKEDEYMMSEQSLPYDVVDGLANQQSDFHVCGELSAHWILDVYANHPMHRSLLSKFGLSKQISILNEKNAPIFVQQLFQNYQQVDACQYALHSKVEHEAVVDYQRIVLKQYSVQANVGDVFSIPIEKLPDGYTRFDLQYQSDNPLVVDVNGNGEATVYDYGGTTIKISTKDQRHHIHLHVSIPYQVQQ